MTRIIKALTAAALVAGLIGIAPARPAAAATPCWKKLLNDWYDGRIDNVYPVHCYQDTLKHLPPDVSVYSSARDDILRALQSAKDQLRKKKETVTPNSPVPAETAPTTTTHSAPSTTAVAGGGGGGGNGPTTTSHGGSGGGGSPPPATTAGTPGRHTDKGLSGVAQQLNTSSPSSVPVPLLVLGGLALLLVAAGAAGLIAKRMHGRDPGS